MQSTIRDLQWGGGQDQRQQDENMREALAGAVLDEVVDEGGLFVAHRIQQPVALPDRTADRYLATDDLEDPFALDPDEAVLRHDRRERAAALEPHFKPGVVERQQQRVSGAL